MYRAQRQFCGGYTAVLIMNYTGILYMLSRILLIETLAFIPSIGVALYDGSTNALRGFLYTAVFLITLSLLLHFIFKNKNNRLYAREGFLVVAFSWIAVSAAGALPFVFSGEIPGYADAFFESVSGFTTTGASSVDYLPSRALLLWRCFSQWLGGMGILVVALAVLRFSKTGQGNSLHLLRAESPGPNVEKIVPKVKQHSAILYIIYLSMSCLCFLFLIFGDMPLFDSLCTTFATAGTGGFSIRPDSMVSYSSYSQIVVTIFMILFGVNFNIYFYIVMKKLSPVKRDEELRSYIILILLSVILICANVYRMFDSISQAVQHVFFTVGSIITTTGYTTVDYSAWPLFSRTILIILMIVGACAGSTSGGIKLSRLLILTKTCYREIRKLLHPRSVIALKLSGETLTEKSIHNVTIFTIIYAFIFFISLLLISFDNLSIETSVTAVVSCLSNIGPGLDVVGPYGSYAGFSALGKIVLAFDMLLGRLEIFPLLILFHYRSWVKGS